MEKKNTNSYKQITNEGDEPIKEDDIEFETHSIGSGAFGKVYKGRVIKTGQIVAVKKVYQDKRYKNRELQIMKELNHPNIVKLISSYFTKGKTEDEIFLNCVMEYVPVTLSDLLLQNKRSNTQFHPIILKVLTFQMLKSLGYLHSIGICHRDIKPQNIMLDTIHYGLKICDFGCAKHLVKGEENIAYICSRYYRSPELVIGATEYTTSVDVWSMGCCMVEMVTWRPLFPGKSAKEQLGEIIRVLGTPTKVQIKEMNPKCRYNAKLPSIPHKDWRAVFKDKEVEDSFIDLIDKLLVYEPNKRLSPFEAMCHPFFDEIKKDGVKLPNGNSLPQDLFVFSETERKDSPELVARLEKTAQ